MNHVDENDALYQRIRSGDAAAVATMIERNAPLVKSQVTLFLKEHRRFRHLFDDLLGEGYLALTEAVNSFAQREVEKPTGCVVSAIDFALSNYVDLEVGAGMMSDRTVQRRRLRNAPLPERLPFDVAAPSPGLWRKASGHVVPKPICADDGVQQISSDTGLAETPNHELDRPPQSSHADARQFIDRFSPDTASELLGEILACCQTEEDEAIVNLRMDGFTDVQIAEQLGMSRQKVNRLRNAIEQRFETKKARP